MLKNTFLFFCISVKSGADFLTSDADFYGDRSLKTELDFAKSAADFGRPASMTLESLWTATI